MGKVKCWIEAMRPRTLPVSTAGVVVASGYACLHGSFKWIPALLCFLFALLAQIASNFANEYFDYRNGTDKKGREGFRRGVTEGDISPRAMAVAVIVTLALSGVAGCCLIPFGGWKLLPIGIAIALMALSYSAGPFPLSRIGLGDVAVVVFFGFVPVCLTFYLQTGSIGSDVVAASAAVGLMGMNVLIVNNYRDMKDDMEAGKRTTVVRFGRPFAAIVYLVSGILSVGLTAGLWTMQTAYIVAPAAYLVLHITTWRKLRRSEGASLNPILGTTARNMLLYALMLLAITIIEQP